MADAAKLVDEQGHPVALATTERDITERKRMEEALRKSHDELERRVEERTVELLEASLYSRGLIEASLDLVVTISADGKITDVNRAKELVTGVGRDQLIGTDFSDYFTESEKQRKGTHRILPSPALSQSPIALLFEDQSEPFPYSSWGLQLGKLYVTNSEFSNDIGWFHADFLLATSD